MFWVGDSGTDLVLTYYRILHFATFVIACVETNKRNRAKRQPQVVYVNGGSQYPPQYGQQGPGAMYSPASPEQVYHHGGMKA